MARPRSTSKDNIRAQCQKAIARSIDDHRSALHTAARNMAAK